MQKTLLDYLRKNFFSLLTIILGLVALVLTQLKFLPPDTIGSTTLALVIFLATSQLVDNARKLEKIEKSITDGFQGAITSLDGVSVIRLDEPEKGLLYLADKVKNAKSRLDHVSLSPPIPRNNLGAIEWEKAIEKVLLSNKVRYRYICAFYDQRRIERVKKHLLNSKISKYFVGYFPSQPHSAPMPNFLLVDDEEVIAIFPFAYGEPEVWVSIKHPEVIKMFSRYFQRLWNDCEKLTGKEITVGALDKL
jgi:hypothetical protein